MDESRITVVEDTRHDSLNLVTSLPNHWRSVVSRISRQYANLSQPDLVRDVYKLYPWYTINSELTQYIEGRRPRRITASPAVYTVGYEKKSVDSFFQGLLRDGIKLIVDVRANPVSRKYGFAKKSMTTIANKLSINYVHHPELGISSSDRVDLSDRSSYQRLLKRYEEEMLPRQAKAVSDVAELFNTQSAALLCMEKDASCCHRSRLAKAVSLQNGLEVVHLK